MRGAEPRCRIIGAGLAGLAAALPLGDAAAVLEADDRPGGLVRTEPVEVEGVGRFWFDRVLHLLYFPDEPTAARVRAMADTALAPCRPVAFVETAQGTTRYPVQMHLAALPPEIRDRCLAGLATAIRTEAPAPADLEQAMRQTFGDGLCELFLLPYNRKAWARPLTQLQGRLAWTVTRPDFEAVLLGATNADPGFSAYNVDGWYPRPPADAPWRGMELVARALAARIARLDLSHRIDRIDVDGRMLECLTPTGRTAVPYDACISTMPLPSLVAATAAMPATLRARAARLVHNRVWTVALCLRGAGPPDPGHWRYYGDEALCFTRLIFMNEFDAHAAPEGCCALMAELIEPAEAPAPSRDEMIRRVVGDARRAGAIGPADELLAADAWTIDPAYVVFTDETEEIVAELKAWFEARSIHLLGRYGRWEYSSMAQVMRDGFALGERLQRKLAC